jgi:FkbM family methyltransferase
MLFIYREGPNKVIRTILKPFSGILPSFFHIPVHGTFPIRLGEGKQILMRANPTSYLARLLYWGGVKGFEYNSVRIFIELAKEANIFFDIGANIGYYSMVAKAFNKRVKVFGFEPMPAANKYFHLNAELNGFSDIQIERKALSDFTGTAKFYSIYKAKYNEIEDHLSGDGGLSYKQSGTRAKTEFDVDCDTLDNYVSGHLKVGERIDLIKLDTEASEHLVLAGSAKVLSGHRPVIQCEVLKGHIEVQMEKILKEYNYLFFKAYSHGLVQVDSLVSNTDDVVDYFMVPAEGRSRIAKFIKG